MPDVVECRGAPRDQGLDQGRACRGAVRRELRAIGGGGRLRALAGLDPSARRTEAIAREVRRHFPQVDERLQGLARGAGVPARALRGRLGGELVRAPDASGGAGADLLAALTPACRGGGPRIVAALGSPPALPAPAPVVRRTHHDPGHVVLDVTWPGLPAALAGVNAAGLAIAVAAGVAVDAPPAAPALVLVQECLQRFETAARALEWCAKRPVGGAATLVAADATGCVRGVAVSPAGRAPIAPEGGLLASGAGADELRAHVRGGGRLDDRALRALLARRGAPGGVVWLDPAGRRVALQTAGAPDFIAV